MRTHRLEVSDGVPARGELVRFLEEAITTAHALGQQHRVDDLLDKRGHVDELLTFLAIIEPYLGSRTSPPRATSL